MNLLKLGSETSLGLVVEITNKGVFFFRNDKKTFLYFSEVEVALGL